MVSSVRAIFINSTIVPSSAVAREAYTFYSINIKCYWGLQWSDCQLGGGGIAASEPTNLMFFSKLNNDLKIGIHNFQAWLSVLKVQ